MPDFNKYPMLSQHLAKHAELGGENISNTEASPIPEPYFPTPTEKQYKKGYFPRFFVVHYEGTVTEVSKKFIKDKQAKLPAIYLTYSIKWYISNTSTDTVPLGVKLPTAEYRNAFTVKSIPSPPLYNYLSKNWEEFLL
jgi:hypothetical protein